MNIEKLIAPQKIRGVWLVSARQIYELTPKNIDYGTWTGAMIVRLKWRQGNDYFKIHFGYSEKGIEMFDHLLPIEKAIQALPQRKKKPEVDVAKEYLASFLSKKDETVHVSVTLPECTTYEPSYDITVPEPQRTIEEVINIKEENGEILISGRELHEFLGIRTEYAKWFSRMAEYGFEENEDYVVIVKNDENPKGGRPSIDHAMKIDMAKEISMLQRNEKGKEARQYFIKCEKKLREMVQTAPKLPQTYTEALESLLLEVKAKEQLQLEVKAKEEVIQVMKPKVEYHDEVINKGDLIPITLIAKDLGFKSAKQLNDILVAYKVIYRNRRGVYAPYAGYEWLITDGYADYKIYAQAGSNPSLQWTEKGRQFIIELLDNAR